MLGVYLHGLFECEPFTAAVVGAAPEHGLEATFEVLADALDEHLDMGRVAALAGVA